MPHTTIRGNWPAPPCKPGKPGKPAKPEKVTASPSATAKYRHWTPAEDAQLAAIFPFHSTKTLAAMVGRTALSIMARAHKLKLRKDDAYMAASCYGFQPGVKSWNAGRAKTKAPNSHAA